MKLNLALEQYGLSKKEARIYLACLKLGEALMSEIAEETGLPRTTLYSQINALIKKRLLSFYIRKKRKYFVSENPEKLPNLLREKIQDIGKVLPQLKSLHDDESKCFFCIKPKIHCYEGREGIKTILSDVLETKQHFLATTSIEDMNKILKDYFSDFIKKRVENNLRVKLLTSREPDSLTLKQKDGRELRETRFIPANVRFKTANYIYGNKVAMIDLGKKTPIGLIIEDEEITHTQRVYFEMIWNLLSH